VIAGASGGWAPAQSGRGWAEVQPHATLSFAREDVEVESMVGLKLRRADVGLGRTVLPVGQLQLASELAIAIDERWRLAIEGLLSFYDRDLAARRWKRAETGLLVTVAGAPEDWAAAARFEVAVHRRLRLELGCGGAANANGRGGAVLPRVGARAGPFGGVHIGVTLELVVGVDDGRRDRVRPIAGLSVEVERPVGR
jgi:hypothetical protein